MTQTTPNPSANPPAPPQTPQTGPQPGPEEPIRVKHLGWKKNPLPPSLEEPAAAGPADPEGPPVSSAPQPGAKSTKSGSSPASSLVDPKVLQGGIEGTVIAITGQIHELLARDAYDQWAQIYIADTQDAAGIAAPASKIVSRHTGDVIGGNPDVGDAISIGIAAAFYAVKQLGRLASAKRARRAGLDLSLAKPEQPAEPGPTAANVPA